MAAEYHAAALVYLDRALDAGFATPWSLEASPEFEELRDDPECRRLVEHAGAVDSSPTPADSPRIGPPSGSS